MPHKRPLSRRQLVGLDRSLPQSPCDDELPAPAPEPIAPTKLAADTGGHGKETNQTAATTGYLQSRFA